MGYFRYPGRRRLRDLQCGKQDGKVIRFPAAGTRVKDYKQERTFMPRLTEQEQQHNRSSSFTRGGWAWFHSYNATDSTAFASSHLLCKPRPENSTMGGAGIPSWAQKMSTSDTISSGVLSLSPGFRYVSRSAKSRIPSQRFTPRRFAATLPRANNALSFL